MTRKVRSGIFAVLVALSSAPIAGAKNLYVVKRLDEYVCIGVTIPSTPGPVSIASLPPVYSGPYPGAAVISSAEETMIAVAPPQPVNGFVGVVLVNQKRGWIKASLVTPWRSLAFPHQHCYAAVMSNGLLGFDYDAPR